jgi:catechol 2,3-dioxygenase-like lactoylglutathione lyase family enzyme
MNPAAGSPPRRSTSDTAAGSGRPEATAGWIDRFTDDSPTGVTPCLDTPQKGDLAYPRTELAKDAHISPSTPSSGEFSIGHAAPTRADVDELLAQAKRAGAMLTQEAHDRPWGIYSGYFRDPDSHLWEVMWNPQLDLTAA